MQQHKSILTTNNLCLKYILNLVNIYYIILIYILNVCTKESESKLSFYSLIDLKRRSVFRRIGSSFSLWAHFRLPWFLLPFCKHYLQSLKIHDETWFYKPYDYTMYIQAISQLLCNITQGTLEKSLACFVLTVHKLQEPDHLHRPSAAVINYHYLNIQKAWLVTHSKQHEFVHFYTLCCSCWWDVVGSVKNYRLD